MSRWLGWGRVPIAVLAVVVAIWLLFEGTGLLRLGPMLADVSNAEPVTAAGVIFLLLLADVILPIPSTPLMVLAGTILGGPIGAALSIAACMASSACSYALGRFARPVVLRSRTARRDVAQLRRFSDRFGWGVFASARALPMLAQTAGVSAGIGRVGFGRFFAATFVGTAPVCALYSVVGTQVATIEQIVMVTAVGFLAALAGLWAARRRSESTTFDRGVPTSAAGPTD